MKSVTNNTMKVKINNTYEGGGSSLGSELSAPLPVLSWTKRVRNWVAVSISAQVSRPASELSQMWWTGTLLGTSDKIQNEFQANKCDPTSFDPKPNLVPDEISGDTMEEKLR